MKRKKPPLKQLHEHVFEIHRAVSDVTAQAAAIYGAVTAHCDMLEGFAPGATAGLRKVAGAAYERMREAIDRLHQL